MIELLTWQQAAARSVSAFQFDPNRDAVTDPAVLAALIRRAASFCTPCSPRTLREQVLRGLEGITNDPAAVPDQVEQSLEAMLAYGDLVELPARDADGSGVMLYLVPPSFVARSSGTIFFIGIPAEGLNALPSSLSKRVQCHAHTRRIQQQRGENLRDVLVSLGLQELPEKLWLRKPSSESPQSVAKKFDQALEKSSRAGSVEGLVILDGDKSVRYYKGRWVSPGRRSGRFVGRREQSFGAPLWCYVELHEGQPLRLYDIPPREWRACDYAWHLQMALDRLRGNPQLFRARRAPDRNSVRLDFFSPLPRWLPMRWDILGEPVAAKGSLFSYILPSEEYDLERKILTDTAWLDEMTDSHHEEMA